MIGLLQRVREARVVVEDEDIGAIGHGIAVLVAVEVDEEKNRIHRFLERVLTYRIFEDENARMNRSVRDIAGGLLLVPQFTLAADTKKGTRPSFSRAAEPEYAQRMFDYLVQCARVAHLSVETGRFGAHMQVHLVNDGPVTFWIES